MVFFSGKPLKDVFQPDKRKKDIWIQATGCPHERGRKCTWWYREIPRWQPCHRWREKPSSLEQKDGELRKEASRKIIGLVDYLLYLKHLIDQLEHLKIRV
jgi:hypothetical protein